MSNAERKSEGNQLQNIKISHFKNTHPFHLTCGLICLINVRKFQQQKVESNEKLARILGNGPSGGRRDGCSAASRQRFVRSPPFQTLGTALIYEFANKSNEISRIPKYIRMSAANLSSMRFMARTVHAGSLTSDIAPTCTYICCADSL